MIPRKELRELTKHLETSFVVSLESGNQIAVKPRRGSWDSYSRTTLKNVCGEHLKTSGNGIRDIYFEDHPADMRLKEDDRRIVIRASPHEPWLQAFMNSIGDNARFDVRLHPDRSGGWLNAKEGHIDLRWLRAELSRFTRSHPQYKIQDFKLEPMTIYASHPCLGGPGGIPIAPHDDLPIQVRIDLTFLRRTRRTAK